MAQQGKGDSTAKHIVDYDGDEEASCPEEFDAPADAPCEGNADDEADAPGEEDPMWSGSELPSPGSRNGDTAGPQLSQVEEEDEAISFGAPLTRQRGHGAERSAVDDDEAISFGVRATSAPSTGPQPPATPRPAHVSLSQVLHGEPLDAHFAEEPSTEPSTEPPRSTILRPLDAEDDIPPNRSLLSAPWRNRTHWWQRAQTLISPPKVTIRELPEEEPDDEMFSTPTPIPSGDSEHIEFMEEEEVVPATPTGPAGMERVRGSSAQLQRTVGTLRAASVPVQRPRSFSAPAALPQDHDYEDDQKDKDKRKDKNTKPPYVRSTEARDRVERPYTAPRTRWDHDTRRPKPPSPLNTAPLQGPQSLRRRRASTSVSHRRTLVDARARVLGRAGRGYTDTRGLYVPSFWETRARSLMIQETHGAFWDDRTRAQIFDKYKERSEEVQLREMEDRKDLRRLAMANQSSYDDRTWGPPLFVPDRLTLRLRPTRVLFQQRRLEAKADKVPLGCPKRRADSVAGTEETFRPKVQRTEDWKGISREEMELYSRGVQEGPRTPEPQHSEEKRLPDASSDKPPRHLILHGPRTPQGGIDDKCISCKRDKPPGQDVQCSKCGRHQFCSYRCKDNHGNKSCCEECKKEHDADSDDEDGEDDCISCGQSKRRSFEEGVPCRHCFRRRFCSLECCNSFGEAHCSPRCFEETNADRGAGDVPRYDGINCVVCDDRIDEAAGRAVPCHGCDSMQFCSIDCKNAHGGYDGYCSAECEFYVKEKFNNESGGQKETNHEFSILEDPCNYDIPDEVLELGQTITGVPQPRLNSQHDNDNEAIINHRLVDGGRGLQYRLEKHRPQSQRWEDAASLEGLEWTSKMQRYWAQPGPKRQRKFSESVDKRFGPSVFPHGRHVFRLEIEIHRWLLFHTRSFEDGNRDGQTIWQYGEDLGEP